MPRIVRAFRHGWCQPKGISSTALGAALHSTLSCPDAPVQLNEIAKMNTGTNKRGDLYFSTF